MPDRPAHSLIQSLGFAYWLEAGDLVSAPLANDDGTILWDAAVQVDLVSGIEPERQPHVRAVIEALELLVDAAPSPAGST